MSEIKLTGPQSAALETGCDTSITAGAGSGKTRVLIEKIFKIIRSEAASADSGDGRGVLEKILCITFTNKAANELAERLAARLEGAARDASDESSRRYFEDVRENINKLSILTLDSFFSRLLRRNSIQAGLPPDFAVCDEGTARLKFYEAVDSTITSTAAEVETPGAPQSITVLNELYAFYKNRANTFDIFSQILDKSIYLKRPAFQFKSPAELAAHIDSRIKALGCIYYDYFAGEIIDFPPFITALDFLEEIAPHTGPATRDKVAALLGDRQGLSRENYDAFFRRLCTEYSNVRLSTPKTKEIFGEGTIDAHSSVIGEVRKFFKPKYDGHNSGGAANITNFEYRFYKGVLELFESSRAAYDAALETENLIDFTKLEEITSALLENETMAGSVSKEYSHILIDEFQDTNAVQNGIINKIWKTARLTIVGDGMQSIYRFRNAQSALFAEMSEKIKERGGMNVKMPENFRTSAPLLAFVNGVFGYLASGGAKAPLADFTYMPLTAASESAKERAMPVEFGFFPRAAAGENIDAAAGGAAENGEGPRQYEFIARRILKLKHEEGYGYKDVLILLSRMTHVRELTAALARHGIPYYLYKSRDFYKKPEILDILNLARFLTNPGDNFCLTGLLRSPLFAVKDHQIFDIYNTSKKALNGAEPVLMDALGELRRGRLMPPSITSDPAELARLSKAHEILEWALETSKRQKPYEAFREIFDKLNVPLRYPPSDGESPLANIDKLVNGTLGEGRTGAGSMHDFLENFEKAIALEFSEEAAQDVPENADAVKIMTIHQSKGLEEKVVMIPELEARFEHAGQVAISDLGDIALSPRPFESGSPESLLCQYYEAVKKYESLQNLFERKRLLYVAMTRAKELLIMTAEFPIDSAGESGDENSPAGSFFKKMPPAFFSNWLAWFFNYLGASARDFAEAEILRPEPKLCRAGETRYLLWTSPGQIDPQKFAAAKAPECASAQIENADMLEIIDYNLPRRASDERALISFSTLREYSACPLKLYKNLKSPGRFRSLAAFAAAGPGDTDGDAPEAAGRTYHHAVELAIKSGSFEAFRKKTTRITEITMNIMAARGEKVSRRGVENIINGLHASCQNDVRLREILFPGRGARAFIEHRMKARFDSFDALGICDLLTVDRSGECVIADFKTGAPVARRFIHPEFDDFKLQLAFYELCALEGVAGIGRVKSSHVIFLSPDGGPVKRYEYSPGDNEARGFILQKCSEIKNILKFEYSEMLKLHLSKKKECERCAYKDECASQRMR